MAIFGRDNRDDNDGAPLPLSEVAFQFDAADLRRIANFLLACADEIASGSFTDGGLHLQDADPSWSAGHPDCDVVVVPPHAGANSQPLGSSTLGRPFTMAAFNELDLTRFDVWAAVTMDGVAVVETAHREACLAWLRQHEYAVTSIDFAKGVGPAVVALGEQFHWKEQFGYRLAAESRNLDALRDGFEFGLKPGQGHVLELLNADVAHREVRAG